MIREYTETDTDALIVILEKANALAHPFLSTGFVAFVKDAMRDIYLPKGHAAGPRILNSCNSYSGSLLIILRFI